MQMGLPKNFIRHPVSQSGEAFLPEKKGLQGGPRVTLENALELLQVEISGQDGRWKLAPPIRRFGVMIKTDPSKKAGVMKNKGVPAGTQDQMVMGTGGVGGGLGGKFPGHAQVNSQPTAGPDSKKHLFAMGMGGKEGLSGNSSSHGHDRQPPENPFSSVEMNRQNSLSQPGIPLFSEKFHFRQLGHACRLAQGWLGASGSWKSLSAKALAKESRLGCRAF